MDYANYTGLQDAQSARDQAMQRLMTLAGTRSQYLKKMQDQAAAEKAKALDAQQEQSRDWLGTGLSGAATGGMVGGPIGALIGGVAGAGLGLWSASKNTKGGFSNALTHPFGQHVDQSDIMGAMGPLASLGGMAAKNLGSKPAVGPSMAGGAPTSGAITPTEELLAQDPSLAGRSAGYPNDAERETYQNYLKSLGY